MDINIPGLLGFNFWTVSYARARVCVCERGGAVYVCVRVSERACAINTVSTPDLEAVGLT